MRVAIEIPARERCDRVAVGRNVGRDEAKAREEIVVDDDRAAILDHVEKLGPRRMAEMAREMQFYEVGRCRQAGLEQGQERIEAFVMRLDLPDPAQVPQYMHLPPG